MPIGRSVRTNTVGSSYSRDPMAKYVKSFMDANQNIMEEGSYDLIGQPFETMRNKVCKNEWKKFFCENFIDSNSINVDPLMDEMDYADQLAMQEQQFENDVKAMYEHAAMANYNPVIGMVFPLHKNILMNMVFDKGAIQKVVAEAPKFTLTMETRILKDTKGNEFDMWLDQNKMTDAILESNPEYDIEIALPENQTTDVLGACGGTINDDLSITTHISAVKLTDVFIKTGDRDVDENGYITSKSPIATEDHTVDEVWYPVDIKFQPGYNQFERSVVAPIKIAVRVDADNNEVRTDTISGTMDHNKFNIFGATGVITAVKLTAQLDTANHMLDTCSVSWKTDTTLIEIPNAIPLTVTISPEEVKDLAALYQVNQLTKVMSLFKTVLANYKDDMIRRFLDDSYDRLPERAKGYGEFDYAVPEGYALDHVEHRYKTFFDFFDTQVTKMLQVLNDPNMVITVFGDPDLIRKITPTEYSYQTPSSIGPVDLDYKRTVVTSDKRVYQFIGSDKLRWNDELIVILCPRNSDRVTYRIYDYQMYVSNEIRASQNPSLPALTAFERYLVMEYQPVQSRVKVLHRTGFRE